METDQHPKQTILFIYGTLKKGFPNYHILSDFILSGDVSLLSPSTATTTTPYPLVVGPLAVPFLLPLPSSTGSNLVSGELVSVSPRALSALDDLEGVSVGHYERRPVMVKVKDGAEVEVEAYFAHRSYAEVMWRRSGEKGIGEYTDEMALEYVKPEERTSDMELPFPFGFTG
ncbi:putative gamma-glutamylcyclotransferase [Carex littledalei]|uniref:Gamma-glutamylcyclotransferase family protein n=1 Tax=Carex littledalei TaxID=544730 RepID=A0A833QVB5_9POAL|nr:putative gamma-glutamylcyclotransferase [Carex littledalei]